MKFEHKDIDLKFLVYNLTSDFNFSDSSKKILDSVCNIIKAILSIKNIQNMEEPVVLIQSNDAGDRCGFICMLLILIFQYLKTKRVDIFQTIRKLRQSRSNMISTVVCKLVFISLLCHFFTNILLLILILAKFSVSL
jgi:hypothetical protein